MHRPIKKNDILRYTRPIRTLCILLLSLLITSGGWLFTRQLLKYKQTQLLAKSGQLHVADSGYSLLREDSSASDSLDVSDISDTSDQPDLFVGEDITEDLTAQILACWESGSSLLSHEPKKGQMNMEQAISAGNSWIMKMAQTSLLPSDLSKKNLRDVSAVLYTQDEKPDFPDYLLSRWIISYTIKDIDISLTIHAAGGQIWQARVTAPTSCLPAPLYSNDEKLLKAALLFVTYSDIMAAEYNQPGTHKTIFFSKNKKLCASVQWRMYTAEGQAEYATVTLRLERV